MRRVIYIWLTAVTLPWWGGASTEAADVGSPCDVAPRVEKTTFQKWPRAAWAAKSSCWLVVWREGDLNEHETDIWCARVASDGSAMDPAGIRVTSAPGIQDHPVVASDGRDFLVAWQDLRSAADPSADSTRSTSSGIPSGSSQAGATQGWDVYAARVTADGRVKEPDGFVVDARPHNQCMPTVVYAGTQYYTAYQAWTENWVQKGYGGYEARGARITADGNLLDVEGVVVAPGMALQPSLGYHEEGGLVMVFIGRTTKGLRAPGGWSNAPGFVRIDPVRGTPVGGVSFLDWKSRKTWDRNYVPGVAVMKDGSTLVTVNGWRGGMTVYRLDRDGARVGDWHRFRKDLGNQCIAPISAMASDGEKTLMTYDFPTDRPSIRRVRGRMTMKTWGWTLSPDGTITAGGESGFPIAGGADVDYVQAVPCAGPKGTFLVVCAEMRGVENTRVAARLVK